MKHGALANIATLSSLLLLALALCVMSGWWLQEPQLTRILPTGVSMVFNTALCFAVLSIALLLPTRWPELRRRGQIIAGFAVTGWALLILSEYLFPLDITIDFFAARNVIDAGPTPGRMAPTSALGMICAGLFLVVMNLRPGRAMRGAARALLLLILLVGISGVVGYSIKLDLLYDWYRFTPMALASAAGFFVLGTALWTSWARRLAETTAQRSSDLQKISITAAGILIVIALTAGLSAFIILQQQTEQTLRSGLALSLQSRVDFFEETIHQGVAAVDFIATRPIFIADVRELTANPRDAAALKELTVGVTSFVSRGFSAVAIYRLDGYEIVRAGSFTTAPAAAIRLKLPHQVDLLWREHAILRARLPLVYRGQTVGTVLAERPLAFATRMLRDFRGLGSSGEVATCSLISSAMLCLPLRFLPEISRFPLRMENADLPMARALRGATGVVIARDYRRQNVLAAYQPIGQLGLGMVMKVDTAELYAPIRTTFQFVLPLLIALVLVGIVLLRWRVTPLVRQLVQSEQASNNMRLALEHAVDGVAQLDATGRYVMVNAAYAQMLDRAPEQLLDTEFAATVHVEDRAALAAADRTLQLHGRAEQEVRLVRKDGSAFYAEIFIVNTRGETEDGGGRYCFVKDIAERKKAEQIMQATSLLDELTGLYNRRGFLALAEQQMRLARYADRVLILFFIDMDGLKAINDQLGHNEGDIALIDIAKLLRNTFRDGDIVARLGGDEFAAVAVDSENGDNSEKLIIERLHAMIRQHNGNAGRKFTLSVSVGAARYDCGMAAKTVEQLLAEADSLMYQNKRDKRLRLPV